MKRTRWAVLALLITGGAVLTGCDTGPTLDTRTFPLENLYGGEAEALVRPYVYEDRAGAPGTMSNIDGALTVRETPDNLEKIARVLAEFDKPREDVRLHFQLIEAGDRDEPDPRIMEVERELREIFSFPGYALVGEAFVMATDRSDIEQALSGGGTGAYEVRGRVYWVKPGTIRLEEIRLNGPDAMLTTTVNIRPGQTVVLGSSTRIDAGTTLFLAVTAQSGESGVTGR